MEIGELAKNPMGYLLEAAHSAAYSGAMANPLYAPESALSGLNGDVLQKFVSVRQSLLLVSYIVYVCLLLFFTHLELEILLGELHCPTNGVSS